MKRCKIGDRAFIIKSRFEENIGKIVRIMRQGTILDWHCESEGLPLRTRVVDASGHAIGYGLEMECEGSDDALMPIRGEPEKEPEKEKEVA